MKSGYVTIVGRPNVGKSTLLNSLVEMKLAITSDKVQTTRNIIEGVYNDDDTQIVFVDTPGIHKPQYKLGNMLNSKSLSTISGVDVILFVVDGASGFGKGDSYILNRLKEVNTPVILVVNKIDNVNKSKLLLKLDEYSKKYDFAEVIPVSALKENNIETLIKIIKPYLTHNELLVKDDQVTNISTNFYVAEVVREKVLHLTKEEVPHAVTCVVEDISYRKNIVDISVLVIVDRDNLKNILIGKNGKMIKEIGSRARVDLEEYFDKKVFLQTHVKVIKDWRDKQMFLKDAGLDIS